MRTYVVYPLPEFSDVKKIIVTGDRNWNNIEIIVDELQKFRSGIILVNGACRGADNICSAVAETLGFIVKSYPADWEQFRKAAGPIRNQQMIDLEHRIDEPIDVCLAFHDNIELSKGTADMLARVSKARIPWKLITSHDPNRKIEH